MRDPGVILSDLPLRQISIQINPLGNRTSRGNPELSLFNLKQLFSGLKKSRQISTFISTQSIPSRELYVQSSQ